MNEFFFGVYPYICLVIFTLGLVFRYVATPGEWNARSSQLFAKRSLATGSYLFHYAIILVFFGHVIGLLIPAYALSAFDISQSLHAAVATFCGKVFAPCVFLGLGILLLRRLMSDDVRASTVPMDLVVLVLIMWQATTGGYQDYFGRFNVFSIVGPWVRGILACQPDPHLMANAPCFIKTHVIFGFTIFAIVPFSRLMHFFSAPVAWFTRPAVEYRRRYENV